ncbi:unnamed protein product [Clonostachys rosea f. rosea IK726]|uniref:Uncharacterized protein n=1 Tax=Clonostachys rosea f. rosea IK726 TaxID=1349383 RepID=A0ACA9USP7_BIOOC|nr:unnamed protein product [Clonostachys rosea f. rosea IK726]
MLYNSDKGSMVRKNFTRNERIFWMCMAHHARCDGALPTCVRCCKLGRFCDYRAPILRVQGRKGASLHGQLQPMYSIEALDTNTPDPFNTLPVEMSFKSRKLLHYFQHLRVDFETYPEGMETGCLSALAHNPAALRDTLLVAGMHYIIRTGDVKTYGSTFLFHKIEIIRQINECLVNQHKEQFIDVTRRIATMCLVESTLGNHVTAETHFQGLVSLLCTYQPANTILGTQVPVNEEQTYRTCNIIHAVRSRMAESARVMQMMEMPEPANLEEYVTTLHAWFSQASIETTTLQVLLTAISMLPSFFTQVPSVTAFCHVESLPFIDCLRSFTALVSSFDSGPGPAASRWQWLEDPVSKLLVTLTNSNAASQLGDIGNEAGGCSLGSKGLMSSWCGVAITSELYLTAVLGLWNAGKPIERRLLRIIFRILVRDLAKQPKKWSTTAGSSDLWLWKHFVGAYSLAWHQSHEHDETLREAEEFFDRSIRIWSESHNIRQWEYARRRLLKITWPQDQPQTLARTVWAKAVGKPQRVSKPKVRTGCITCKTRHVKCDERKPTCQRCTTAEITCQGYSDMISHPKPKFTTARISTTLVPLRPKPETLI